jgi:hypothetical protein
LGLGGDGLKQPSTLGPDQVLQLLLRQPGEILPRANAPLPKAQQFAPVKLNTQLQQRKRTGKAVFLLPYKARKPFPAKSIARTLCRLAA